jgi:ParB-like chromosome segregation protein Spo0J
VNQLPSWPADRVERWPLERIHESPQNPRTHSDEQVEAIAASLQEFGWTIPILLDESGNLIAGHGRLFAARLLGMQDAPVLVARGWTDAQKRAYRIADNKLALNAGWDALLLSGELSALAEEGFAIDILGFSDDDMARLTDDMDRLTLDCEAQEAAVSDPTEAPQADIVTLPASESVVPFSCMLVLADRPLLLEAIARAKAQGAPDSGAALVMIAREWMQA